MNKKIPIGSMFLGPKSENATFLLETITQYLNDHVYWRRNFHPEDDPVISALDVKSTEYTEIHAEIVQKLFRLTSRLKKSVPFFSPRYLGHMTSDVMIPSILGYIATLLYNPNNVSWEGSPVTSQLELEVGQQIAELMGYGNTPGELRETWGHITSGGTVANLEALWVALSWKYFPLFVRNTTRDLKIDFAVNDKSVQNLSNWEAMNLSVTQILAMSITFQEKIADSFQESIHSEIVKTTIQNFKKKYSIQSLGIYKFSQLFSKNEFLPEIVLLIPQTKHYSWKKAPEIFGLGSSQVIEIPVDQNYRQDMTKYKDILYQIKKDKKTPVMSVVVCGTTEEGAIDRINEIVNVRKEMNSQGLSYWLHCDAAWGGYIRSILIDGEGNLKTKESIQEKCSGWPSLETYESLKATKEMDSITIDPHKMGYVPYPAGAIVFKNILMREIIAHEAPYALGSGDNEEIFIGRYIIEGSKPGTSVAAVWLNHEVFPLNEHGYGNLIGKSISQSIYFAEKLEKFNETIQDYDLIVANLPIESNIVCYFFNPKENKSLKKMNLFNEAIFKHLSVCSKKSVHAKNFYISHTKFSFREYSADIIMHLLKKTSLVVDPEIINENYGQYAKMSCGTKYLTVLRSTIMNPFTDTLTVNYIDKFIEELPEILNTVALANSKE